MQDNRTSLHGSTCDFHTLRILETVAKKGDKVEFFENINVVEVANLYGTISYEILCGIS